MEDNFQHRQDLVKPDETLSKYSENKYLNEDERLRQDSGIGPRSKDGKHDKRRHSVETNLLLWLNLPSLRLYN